MLNLAAAGEGGLGAQFFAIWAEPTEWRGRFAHRTLELIDGLLRQIEKHSDTMALGTTAHDIELAYEHGKFCALMGIEGGHSIENSLALLRIYYDLGVRYMTLTWSNTNEWADSSGDLDDATVKHHGGLTEFGRDVVREMNKLGMMVDVSHVSDETFWDVLRTTRSPIIASHSSARALTNSLRNLTDEQLGAIATNNGIVMVNFYPNFIDDAWREAWAATSATREALYAEAEKLYRAQGAPVPYAAHLEVDRRFFREVFSQQQERPSVEILLDHFDHVIKVAGIDHVGIGSDFDGFALTPAGMETAAQLPEITRGLMERGYTVEQVRKVLGENLLRVMRAVEAESEREG